MHLLFFANIGHWTINWDLVGEQPIEAVLSVELLFHLLLGRIFNLCRKTMFSKAGS